MHEVVIGDARLILGNCMDVLPTLGKVDAVVTDPVWPNCPSGLLIGADGDQQRLLAGALDAIEATSVVLVLGFDSDPRFLVAVPGRWPFIRSQQLPYAMPGYRGRLLGGDEVAYVFGQIPKGNGLIPGRGPTETTKKLDRENGHPCPRTVTHTKALVGWWSCPADIVLDPFMGSGTTGVACIQLGRKFIGIEKEERYFDIAVRRIEQAHAQGRLFAPEPQKQEQEALL